MMMIRWVIMYEFGQYTSWERFFSFSFVALVLYCVPTNGPIDLILVTIITDWRCLSSWQRSWGVVEPRKCAQKWSSQSIQSIFHDMEKCLPGFFCLNASFIHTLILHWITALVPKTLKTRADKHRPQFWCKDVEYLCVYRGGRRFLHTW